jgi:hypothetical protein
MLTQVCTAMEYGHGSPSALEGFPIGGYLPQTVSEAVLMVCTARLLTLRGLLTDGLTNNKVR